MEQQVDWSVFDGDPEMTCTCRCGKVFRSHVKGIMVEGKYVHLTRKPCPACGASDDICAVSSDPEYWSVRG